MLDMLRPHTLALDFDGVLCDGLPEYFQASWLAYRQIWLTSDAMPPPGLEPHFRQLRPVVTHGWEMPLVLRALIKGFTPAQVQQNWLGIQQRILMDEDINSRHLGRTLDQVRDRWIDTDWQGWLNLHQFYPGVVTRLGAWIEQELPWVIITTKETRFVKYLLTQAHLPLPIHGIYGKDCQRSKVEVLKELQHTLPQPLWFVEDRLAALDAVAVDPHLVNVQLFLANWGYTTPQHCQAAAADPRIHLLGLEQFCQDFETWV